jgi:hypothetical protein
VLPPLPGGNATISMTQGPYQANTTFVVTAALGLSTTRGAVGANGVATGSGFAASAPYSVVWNASTTLCTGTANASGEFSCPYAIPGAPAGLHTITAVQGTVRATETFSVLPRVSLSAVNGTVGASVTVFGTGFDAAMHYQVSWNSSTVLCSGSTNTNGAFDCSFVVPQTIAGPATITTAEGGYAPTTSFTVVASPPPPPASSTPFPWWIVAVVALVLMGLLVVALVFEQRRHRRSRSPVARPSAPRPVQPWEEGPAPLAVAGPVAAVVPGAASTPPAGGGTPAAAGVAAPAVGEPEDIDAMIAQLEKMSLEMFKKTPKQLSEQGYGDDTGASSKGS